MVHRMTTTTLHARREHTNWCQPDPDVCGRRTEFRARERARLLPRNRRRQQAMEPWSVTPRDTRTYSLAPNQTWGLLLGKKPREGRLRELPRFVSATGAQP